MKELKKKRKTRKNKRALEEGQESGQIWRREKKIQWGGNKGRGGVLELGKLGARVPEFSRDGTSYPRLTGGVSGGHDGQACDIAPTLCWVTD